MRGVARRFGVALRTVQYWVKYAGDRRLDRIDFASKSTGATPPDNRTRPEMEALLVDTRRELRDTSALGEYGALAVHQELTLRGVTSVPSVSTIHRVFRRNGLLTRRRIRHPAPPPGWYLPNLETAAVELDSFDFIEELRIENGPLADVLNGVSLHGGLPASWPAESPVSAIWTLERLVEHWRLFGLPAYAQFDNDTRFQGAHQFADSFGRIVRLCLGLGVVPVFAPPRETGFQGAVEGFNSRWKKGVWNRFHHDSLPTLATHSEQYVTAYRIRHAKRIEGAPPRAPFPRDWSFNYQLKPRGRLIYVRRADEQGRVRVLGHTTHLRDGWGYRLTRCEVLFDEKVIRFFGLRRREPSEQPLLKEVHYDFASRLFSDSTDRTQPMPSLPHSGD